jgi:hypothetical protein
MRPFARLRSAKGRVYSQAAQLLASIFKDEQHQRETVKGEQPHRRRRKERVWVKALKEFHDDAIYAGDLHRADMRLSTNGLAVWTALGRTASKLETIYLRFRITPGGEENQQRKQAAQRPLEIQGHAMKGEFRPHRFQTAPMKPLEALAFAQFGKARLNNSLASPISGASPWMIH